MQSLLRILLVFSFVLIWTADVHNVYAHSFEVDQKDSSDLPFIEVASIESNSIIHVPGDVADLQQASKIVPDGGTIELAAGIYPSPDGGFALNEYSLIT